MARPIKLAIIGAGSASFSLSLVKDLCLTPNMAGSLVCMMDINGERANMVCKLATRHAQELGKDDPELAMLIG
jgi:alpha-galactosidase/6-phospho-beta-glucosidase family protein